MAQFKAKVISNKEIAPEHYLLWFKAPGVSKKVKPGQFFNVRVADSYKPFLRRPLGTHDIAAGKIAFLYKVIGEATTLLSAKKKGDVIDIIGPLGNGFNLKKENSVILVAGGHGTAPLYALAKRLGIPKQKISVFIGAKTKKHVISTRDFRKLGAKVYVATDDGSSGHKGLVTEVLQKKLKNYFSKNPKTQKPKNLPTVYACGPKPMLEAVAKIAGRYGIPCQVSLEEYMACGVGTCLGCAVKTCSGYKMVCKDGPVFDAKEIVW